MKVKPPRQRRKFANAWDEVQYLYDHLLYWLYQREDMQKAGIYALRLKPLLRRVAADHEAVFGEECWSLVYEALGDLPKAIAHRENEIRLIRRLHELSDDSPHRDVALRDYGWQDLSDRLDLLATLYHDSRALDAAIHVLQESKRMCLEHGLRFDAEDLLEDYRAEADIRKNDRLVANGSKVNRKIRQA